MTSNSDRDQEMAGLKARVSVLEARVAMLEPKPAASPSPQSDRRPVTITRPLPVPENMPTDDELGELLRRVRDHYATFRPPSFATEQQLHEYFAAFKAAFRWLIVIGRTPEPNLRYDYDDLCRKCYEHCRLINAGVPPMNFGPILAAAIATGDIVFDDPATAPYPYCRLGVNADLQRTYSGAYKQILAGERDFLQPTIKQRRAS